ncbi:MAG: Wzy polymerase domain-containing protein [Janthinobacterium lividum]
MLIAAPFLSPLVAGPSANVWQLLVSWVCVALLVSIGPRALPSRWPLAALGLLLATIVWRGADSDASALLGAVVAVGATALAACVGAGLARAPRAGRSALAWGLLAAGLASAMLGLLQYYGAAAALAPFTTAPELGQAYGNLRQRNQFATLISMALVAALWLHATAPASSRSRIRAWLLPVSAPLLVLAAAASTSRTGLLQWASIALIAAALAWGERRAGGKAKNDHLLPHPLLLLGLVPAYFAAAVAVPLLAGPEVEDMLRRLREGAPAGNSRLLLWRNVMDLIALHPWAGWGWGQLSFAHFDTLYAGPRFVEILDNAHNLPLQLAVEVGVPAALLFCGVCAAMVLAARPWRERDPTRLMAWGVLGAIVLHSLLEYPLWYGPFQLVFGLCLGLLWPAPAGTTGTQPKTPAIVAVALLLSAVAYAAWDYTRISQIYLPRAARLAPWRDDTLAKLDGSWLYASQVRFAALTLMPVTRANAAEAHALALRVVRFSPEPKVIAKLVESAVLLGLDDEAAGWAARFKIAFPDEYGRWLAGKPMEKG